MIVHEVVAQIRTTDLEESISFYIEKLEFKLEFRFSDFYAGIKVAENQQFHLKLVDEKDPSIDLVREHGHQYLFFSIDDVDAAAERFKRAGVQFHREIEATEWGARVFYVYDNQGHVLCFAQSDDEQ